MKNCDIECSPLFMLYLSFNVILPIVNSKTKYNIIYIISVPEIENYIEQTFIKISGTPQHNVRLILFFPFLLITFNNTFPLFCNTISLLG